MRDKFSKQNTAEGTSGTISGAVKQDPDKVFGASPASQSPPPSPPLVRILFPEHPTVTWRQQVNQLPTASFAFTSVNF